MFCGHNVSVHQGIYCSPRKLGHVSRWRRWCRNSSCPDCCRTWTIAIVTGNEKKETSLNLGAEYSIDFKLVKDPAQAVVAIADGIGAHAIFVIAASAYKIALPCTGKRVGGCIMPLSLRKCLRFPLFAIAHCVNMQQQLSAAP